MSPPPRAPQLRALSSPCPWGCSPRKTLSVLLALFFPPPPAPPCPSLPRDTRLSPSVCRAQTPVAHAATAEGTGLVSPIPCSRGDQVMLLGVGCGPPPPAALLYPSLVVLHQPPPSWYQSRGQEQAGVPHRGGALGARGGPGPALLSPPVCSLPCHSSRREISREI